MALPTASEVKEYLRLTTDVEDALIARLLTQAQAKVESYLGVPITAVARTFTDHTNESHQAYGNPRRLVVPITPITDGSVTGR